MSADAFEAPPEITVVVVNYNSGDYLAGCIASLARQSHRNFETIIVDNNSTDGSLDRLGEKPERLTILRQAENLGFAGGNNVGAAAGKGRWLALLNPDAEADTDWLDAMMRAIDDHPEHRMVACLQTNLLDPTKLDGAGDNYLAYGYAWRGGFGHPASKAPAAGECFGPCGAAALYPRDLFLEAGGFDERYFCYHEDVDIAFRLRLFGECCQFAPSARIRHAGSAVTGRSSYFSVFHGVRNGVWTYAKNMPGGWLILTLPIWFIGAVLLLLRGLARGVFRPTWNGFMAGLAGLGPMLKSRRELRKRRKARVSDIAAAFTWNPFAYLGRQIDVRPFQGPNSD
ncbi:MAG: glycosyltransferase family 2 protein [Alphaproteobacteria bacterium]|nr:MAG: glycosyltransferase family 2 protein [Alphaproteobacteria bacterium]